MYHWVEGRDFLKKAYSECSGIVNQLVQELKNYDIESSMNVVGSKGRNMVTQSEEEPIDFDFNLMINNADMFDARKLKEDVREAFNTVLNRNGWADCDDSTSALTTKKKNYKQGNRTPFSMDVCIVKRDAFGHLHRLIHQKHPYVQLGQWYWNQVSDLHDLQRKETELKASPKHWQMVRKAYLDKKNMYLLRGDHDHPSFVCYIEAVNEVYSQTTLATNAIISFRS